MHNKAINPAMLILTGIIGTRIGARQVAGVFFHFLNKWKTNTFVDMQDQIQDWAYTAGEIKVPISHQIEET
jgi:hypothetical protein